MEKQEEDADFSVLLRETASQPKELAQSLIASMAPLATLELMELVQQNDNLTTKLNAIKTALDRAGVAQNDQGGFAGGFVNVNVKMFGKEDGKVIDVSKE